MSEMINQDEINEGWWRKLNWELDQMNLKNLVNDPRGEVIDYLNTRFIFFSYIINKI